MTTLDPANSVTIFFFFCVVIMLPSELPPSPGKLPPVVESFTKKDRRGLYNSLFYRLKSPGGNYVLVQAIAETNYGRHWLFLVIYMMISNKIGKRKVESVLFKRTYTSVRATDGQFRFQDY